MPTDPTDVPDMIRIDAASIPPFETGRRELKRFVIATSIDPEWTMTNDERVPDWAGLGLNVRASWMQTRTGHVVEIETRRGIGRMSVRLLPGGRADSGPVIRVPRGHDHGHDHPAAVLDEALAVLDAAARRLALSGDQGATLEAWARGAAAIADAAFGTRTTTVRFATPLDDARTGRIPSSADGERRTTELETCEGTLPIAHPEARSIAAIAPNAYAVASDVMHTEQVDVRVMACIHSLRRLDQADDPVGTMRALAFVREALDAGRRA
jgi:hypothetical protein